jgi:ribosomal-protein-alanine N-acetyltransferase
VNSKALIRLGSPADLLAVERIERASFDDPWVRSALLQELVASPLRLPLVAEIAGEVVGYLMAWRSADELHILNIAVDPARRRLGLGAGLLREALGAAEREGMSAVSLEVRLGNEPALQMYQAFGFRQTGRRPGYYADTGEDALILTLTLD